MRSRSTVRLAPRQSVRRGLTLMELVVVLTVLAAVAAIIVPLLPNLLRRAHKATDATQSSELAKAILTYQGTYYSYPKDWDLLTDGSAIVPYLPSDGGAVFGGFVTAGSLTADELAALRRAGIDRVQPMAATTTGSDFKFTRFPYTNGATPNSNGVELDDSQANTLTFAVLNTSAVNNHLMAAELAKEQGSTVPAKYIVLGVGTFSSMVGSILHDAPMSVPQDKELTPATVYSRFGAIFKVNGNEVYGPGGTRRARFITTVALEDDELEAPDKDIEGFYEVSRDGA